MHEVWVKITRDKYNKMVYDGSLEEILEVKES